MARTRTDKTPRCVLTLRLLPEPWQADIIETRFRLVEQLKDELTRIMNARYSELANDFQYKETESQIHVIWANLHNQVCDDIPRLNLPASSLEARLRQLYQKRNEQLKAAGFTQYGFDAEMMVIQKRYKNHIATQIASTAAADVWRAFSRFLYKGWQAVHTKPAGSLRSISNKSPNCTMRYNANTFYWNGGQSKDAVCLAIRVAPPANDYEREMLKKRICFYRVVRYWSKSGYRYSLQLTLEGHPVRKTKNEGAGKVGLYVSDGMITACTVNDLCVMVIPEFMPQDIWSQITTLRAKMAASRRAMNPDNYNNDGTLKKGEGNSIWVVSSKYKKLEAKLQSLHKKAADRRRYESACLVNKLLSLGDEFYINLSHTNDPRLKHSPHTFVRLLDKKLKSSGHKSIHEVKDDVLCKPDDPQIPEAAYKAFLLMTSSDATAGPERPYLRDGYQEFVARATRPC